MPKLFDYTNNRRGRLLGTIRRPSRFANCMGLTEDGKLIYEYITTSNLHPDKCRVFPYEYEVQRLAFAMFAGNDKAGNPTFEWYVLANEGTTSQLEKQRLAKRKARTGSVFA